MIDFEHLAAHSLDHVLSADDEVALRVWGDQLDADGDPRGALIALEHAARGAPKRRHFFAKLALDQLVATARDWLGEIHPLRATKRALELDIRAGRLYGAFVDLRHVPGNADDHHALVSALLAPPFAHTLRRLHVRSRARSPRLIVAPQLTELEELLVLDRVRVSDVGQVAGFDPARYRRLRSFGYRGTLAQLPIELADVVAATDPGDPAHRFAIGRGLNAAEPEVRAAAYRAVMRAGPHAFVFVDQLMDLLDTARHTEVALCLGAIGARAERAIARLATITGRGDHGTEQWRGNAGIALAQIRAALSSRREP